MDEIDKKLNKLLAERSELDLLIEKGIFFECGSETLTIQEPVLRVLDFLAAEMVRVDIEDNILSNSDEAFDDGCRLVGLHSSRMAKIVAIAVLGLESKNNQQLSTLVDSILDNIRPSKLESLFNAVKLLMNVGSFTNSIRLTKEIKASLPGLIERGE